MVSAAFYGRYIWSKRSVFSFRISACSAEREIWSEILKVGVPTLIFQLLTSLSISMINDAAKVYGSSALAGMGPVTKKMCIRDRPR